MQGKSPNQQTPQSDIFKPLSFIDLSNPLIILSQKQEWKRKKCRQRAGIEPVIGHLKSDHRMLRNYLKDTLGDKINALLAASAFNFKKALNEIKHRIIFWLHIFLQNVKQKIQPKFIISEN